MVTTKKPEEIADIKREMYCRIEQLEEKTDTLEAKAGFAKVGKMIV
jgi:L-amino acid N-acyltransferase YncA